MPTRYENLYTPPQYVQDPDAVKDYPMSWVEYLGDDEILTAEAFVVEIEGDARPFVVADFTNTATHTFPWCQGGTLNQKYCVTTRVVTLGGITDDRSIFVTIKEQ